MKKLVFAAFAAIALTASVSFVSCGGNATTADTTNAQVVDSQEVVDEPVDSQEVVDEPVDSQKVETPAEEAPVVE